MCSLVVHHLQNGSRQWFWHLCNCLCNDLCYDKHPESLWYHQDRFRSHHIQCLESTKRCFHFHVNVITQENLKLKISVSIACVVFQKLMGRKWLHVTGAMNGTTFLRKNPSRCLSRAPKVHGHAVNVIKLADEGLHLLPPNYDPQ